jgi:hypothetical protein
MPFVQRRRDDHQEEGDPTGLVLDMDELACPTCHRPLHPWQPRCPADDSPAVPRTSLRTMDPPPAHLLED